MIAIISLRLLKKVQIFFENQTGFFCFPVLKLWFWWIAISNGFSIICPIVCFLSHLIYSSQFRAGAAWGARGARAPPVFLGEGNKKLPNSVLQKGLFSIVHPLKLAPCAGPEIRFYIDTSRNLEKCTLSLLPCLE